MLPPHSCRIKHQRPERLSGACVWTNHRFKWSFDITPYSMIEYRYIYQKELSNHVESWRKKRKCG